MKKNRRKNAADQSVGKGNVSKNSHKVTKATLKSMEIENLI